MLIFLVILGLVVMCGGIYLTVLFFGMGAMAKQLKREGEQERRNT